MVSEKEYGTTECPRSTSGVAETKKFPSKSEEMFDHKPYRKEDNHEYGKKDKDHLAQ